MKNKKNINKNPNEGELADKSINAKSKANSSHKGKKIWKITAMAVLLITALLIAGGLIKVYYFKSFYIKPTQTQIDYATKIATAKLQSAGSNASAFQVQAGRKMRRLHESGSERTIMQISFNNDITSHEYLIDVNTGEVLLHSETDAYIPFGENRKKHKNNYDEELFEHDRIK